MSKIYAVTVYHKISDPEKFSAYAQIAAPVITAGGGKFLARGNAVFAYENGILERTVIVEFPDLETARLVYDGPGYKKALDALAGSAIRDIRLVEAI